MVNRDSCFKFMFMHYKTVGWLLQNSFTRLRKVSVTLYRNRILYSRCFYSMYLRDLRDTIDYHGADGGLASMWV